MTLVKGQIGNSNLVRQLNSAVVYQLIDQTGAISRMQIAEQSQLAPASVTKITRQLLGRGLIAEQEQQASTGGRRAISLVPVTHPFHTIALQLGRKTASLALYDLAGVQLAAQSYPLLADNQQMLEQTLLGIVDQFISQHQSQLRELIAIAIIAPGLVLDEQGIIDYMPHISVTHWSLARIVEQHYHVSCFIGHDIRSLTLAEHFFGKLQDCDDAIFVRVHQGTGAGILSAGKIFTGRHGYVGEIGHIQVDPLGSRCHCGNFGCLETIAANDAIERRARYMLNQGYQSRLSTENCHIQAICQAACQGDQLACAIISNVARYLGQAIAVAINLLNPQKIIIAGEITSAQSILLPAIHASLNHQVLPAFRQHLPVLCSSLNDNPTIGAFALVKRAMLDGVLLQRLLDKKQRVIKSDKQYNG